MRRSAAALQARPWPLRRHHDRHRRHHRFRHLHQPLHRGAASRFVDAGDRRVGHRRGDRADWSAVLRRAWRDETRGRRAVRLPPRCLPSTGRVPVRMGAAVHDRGRRHGGRRHDVRGVRRPAGERSTAGLGAGRHRRRARHRGGRDRVPVGDQLPRRDPGQPPAQRLRDAEGRGARGVDCRRLVVQRHRRRGAAPRRAECRGFAGGVRRRADSDRVRLRRLAERELRGGGDQGCQAHPADARC